MTPEPADLTVTGNVILTQGSAKGGDRAEDALQRKWLVFTFIPLMFLSAQFYPQCPVWSKSRGHFCGDILGFDIKQ